MTSLSIGYPSFDSELTMALETNHQSRMGELWRPSWDAERLLAGGAGDFSDLHKRGGGPVCVWSWCGPPGSITRLPGAAAPRATLALVQACQGGSLDE